MAGVSALREKISPFIFDVPLVHFVEGYFRACCLNMRIPTLREKVEVEWAGGESLITCMGRGAVFSWLSEVFLPWVGGWWTCAKILSLLEEENLTLSELTDHSIPIHLNELACSMKN